MLPLSENLSSKRNEAATIIIQTKGPLQFLKAGEEMSELTQAILKSYVKGSIHTIEARDRIEDELGDVLNTFDTLLAGGYINIDRINERRIKKMVKFSKKLKETNETNKTNEIKETKENIG